MMDSSMKLEVIPQSSSLCSLFVCLLCLSAQRCFGAGELAKRPGGPWLILHRSILCQILGERWSESHTHTVGFRSSEMVCIKCI